MKNRFLKVLIVMIALSPTASYPLGGTSSGSMKVSMGCLGLDGIPIAAGTSAATQCCTTDSQGNPALIGNAPDICRTSLYGAGTAEANAGTGSSLNIAQNTLDNAKDLSGSTSNLTPTDPSSDPGNQATGGNSLSSALTSGSGGSVGSGTGSTGDGAGSYSGAGNPEGDSASGAGGSAAGAGAGNVPSIGTTGSGAGSTANGVAGANSASGAGAKGEDAAGKYSSGNGGSGADGSSGGKVGGLFNSLFGNSGKVGADAGADNIKFGDQALDADGKPTKDEFATGSAIDPGDYFNRIDKSASIFKVVSNRYAKETERKHIGIAAITK